MAKHRLGGPAAQQLHVIDAVPAGDHGVDQGEQLAPRAGRARPVPEVNKLVGGLLDPQPLRQGRRQQQPGASHRPLVIEGDIDLVQHHVGRSHRKGVLRLGDRDRLAAVILPGQGTLFIMTPLHAPSQVGGSRLNRVLIMRAAVHRAGWLVLGAWVMASR